MHRAATVTGNKSYDNAEGVRMTNPQVVANNIIYDNTTYGIHVRSAGNNRIENNTVYQPVGDAVFVDFTSNNVQLRNNILWVASGNLINVAPDSEAGFVSDYNSLITTGAGKLALWEGRRFATLDDWFYEVGFDQHSQTTDPGLNDPAGLDNVLGYDAATTGVPRFMDDSDPGFSFTGSWDNVQQTAGFAGDFVEATGGFNQATWHFSQTVGYANSVQTPVSAYWVQNHNLGTATYSQSTSASWTVSVQDAQGHITVQPRSASFFSDFATTNQGAAASTGFHDLATLTFRLPRRFHRPEHCGRVTHYAQLDDHNPGQHDLMADAITAFGSTVDDGDSGFNIPQGYNWIKPGIGATYHTRGASDSGVASWQFTGLTPGASYTVATTWTPTAGLSQSATIGLYDGDRLVRWLQKDLTNTPADFTENAIPWRTMGIVQVTGDRLVVTLSGPGNLQADSVRIQELFGDRGPDDDFGVAISSPTIDAGDPSFGFSNEPAPSGGRINLGHTGNTPAAMPSPAQFVQVLAPFGREKFEQGQQVSVQWRDIGHRRSGRRLRRHDPGRPSDRLLPARRAVGNGRGRCFRKWTRRRLYRQPGTGGDRCHAG